MKVLGYSLLDVILYKEAGGLLSSREVVREPKELLGQLEV